MQRQKGLGVATRAQGRGSLLHAALLTASLISCSGAGQVSQEEREFGRGRPGKLGSATLVFEGCGKGPQPSAEFSICEEGRSQCDHVLTLVPGSFTFGDGDSTRRAYVEGASCGESGAARISSARGEPEKAGGREGGSPDYMVLGGLLAFLASIACFFSSRKGENSERGIPLPPKRNH